MEKNYCDYATNWWVAKIENSVTRPINGLDLFKESLYAQIKYLSEVNASVSISTYNSSNKLLDEIAFYSGLDVPIPSGYEMRIIFNNVFVYNSHAELVASF